LEAQFARMMTSAPYMRWAKTRPRVTYDLASSGLLPVTTEELLGSVAAKDAFQISGPNDEGFVPLREAIGRRYQVRVDEVAIAPGASGANFLAVLALAGPGDDVLVESPAYDPLLAVVRVAGANVMRFARQWETGFALDPDAVAHAMTPRTRLIILSNAHNPSGALAPAETLRQIGDLASVAGALVLVDEVYAEARIDDDLAAPPAARLGESFITTSSLTKAYGLAGLRCGWVLAAPAVAERIRVARDVVDGSGPFVAERLALTAFEHIDRLRARARAILDENLHTLRAMAASHPRLEWLEPHAGTTAFPRVRGVEDTSALVDRLIREHDTIVVPGRFFQAPQHIRIAFGGEPAIVRTAVERLAIALQTLER
jgi:hypothetical protein